MKTMILLILLICFPFSTTFAASFIVKKEEIQDIKKIDKQLSIKTKNNHYFYVFSAKDNHTLDSNFKNGKNYIEINEIGNGVLFSIKNKEIDSNEDSDLKKYFIIICVSLNIIALCMSIIKYYDNKIKKYC